MDATPVQKFLLAILSVSIALGVGLIVLTSLTNTQTTYGATCNVAGYPELNATNSNICVRWTSTVGTIKGQHITRVNTTVPRLLNGSTKRNSVCAVSSVTNHTDISDRVIGAGNYTINANACSIVIAHIAPYQNKNLSANYTVTWDNNTGEVASVSGIRASTVAGNATRSVSTQLASVPQWIGIIITVALAFMVLNYFYNKM